MSSSTKKALITGITGFAGSYLAEHLLSTGSYEVSGTFLTEESLKNVEGIKSKINLIKADLSQEKEVCDIVRDVLPDVVFHLAALTSPADSFKNPTKTLTSNIALQVNLLESIKKNNLIDAKILIVSSADIYGVVKREDLPIDELTPLMPTSPYGVSKIAQDFLGLTYFLSYKLRIVRVRPFNHIGPKQSPHFAVSSFAKQIAEIEKGKREPTLHVGNLDAKRDFTNVKDMVNAYTLAIEKGREGEVYNIGSGISYKMLDILDQLISLSSSKITIEKDEALIRPTDNPELLCDVNKFRKVTKWKPKISMQETLKDTLDYWRNII
ncbi:MAG: GDP-mannose 4,6-dehydratase [Candidatus Levybacteria bacterium]|nr:GDP-mannose 4,6-dehydratase [Candidatus Levybacteria bacterium]